MFILVIKKIVIEKKKLRLVTGTFDQATVY